jgi:hypothetical protein
VSFETVGASKKPILRGGAETIDFSFSIGRDQVCHQPGASV